MFDIYVSECLFSICERNWCVISCVCAHVFVLCVQVCINILFVCVCMQSCVCVHACVCI